MTQTLIHDHDDPRLAPFRDVRERDLTGRQGCFIAEGAVVLRLLASPASLCRALAVLVSERKAPGLSDVWAALDPQTPVLVAPQAVLDGVAGFHLHRGVLALARKPAPEPLEALLARTPDEGVLLAAAGIGNHDNMGGLFRNAAAFGATGVVLDDACCDPFYRKAVRVSVGAVLRTPMARGGAAPDMVEALLAAGYDVAALSPRGGEPLAEAARRGRTALLVGAEGPGLPRAVIDQCRAVSIPMSGGFDSLNVATAAALALHQFTAARNVAGPD